MTAIGIDVDVPVLDRKTVSQPYVKAGGVWRTCSNVYAKDGGIWNPVWPVLQIIPVVTLFGGSFNGGEQVNEFNNIKTTMMNNGVFSGSSPLFPCYVHSRDSNAYWILTSGNYFYVDGTFIGTTMQIDHWQDGLGVDDTIHSPCAGGGSSYVLTQGRWNTTLYIYKYT